VDGHAAPPPSWCHEDPGIGKTALLRVHAASRRGESSRELTRLPDSSKGAMEPRYAALQQPSFSIFPLASPFWSFFVLFVFSVRRYLEIHRPSPIAQEVHALGVAFAEHSCERADESVFVGLPATRPPSEASERQPYLTVLWSHDDAVGIRRRHRLERPPSRRPRLVLGRNAIALVFARA